MFYLSKQYLYPLEIMQHIIRALFALPKDMDCWTPGFQDLSCPFPSSHRDSFLSPRLEFVTVWLPLAFLIRAPTLFHGLFTPVGSLAIPKACCSNALRFFTPFVLWKPLPATISPTPSSAQTLVTVWIHLNTANHLNDPWIFVKNVDSLGSLFLVP